MDIRHVTAPRLRGVYRCINQVGSLTDKQSSVQARTRIFSKMKITNKKASMTTYLRDNLESYGPASNLMHNEKVREMIADGKPIYHFGFGQSPFPILDTAVESLKKHASKSAYLPVAGIPALREAICNFHRKYDDLTCNPEDILVGPGSKELIFLAMNVFKGDILVISPSWTTYKPQVMFSQHKPHILQTSLENHWKLTPAILRKYLEENDLDDNKLLIMNNPDNPTGTSYTKSELVELSNVCKQYNVLVLSDEIYARLKFDNNHVSMAKVYPEGTILCTGLSKWASAGGWRVGYHIYPAELGPLRHAVRSAASHTYTSIPAPIQYAITDFLQDEKGCHEYIQHTNRIMAAVAKHCHRQLTGVGAKALLPTGGFYIFPDFEVIRESLKKRGVTTSEELVQTMFDESSVSVMAGGPAFLRPPDELTTRLCYVDFDGDKALNESRRIGLKTPLPENFIQEHCEQMYLGIKALTDWVEQQKKAS